MRKKTHEKEMREIHQLSENFRKNGEDLTNRLIQENYQLRSHIESHEYWGEKERPNQGKIMEIKKYIEGIDFIGFADPKGVLEDILKIVYD